VALASKRHRRCREKHSESHDMRLSLSISVSMISYTCKCLKKYIRFFGKLCMHSILESITTLYSISALKLAVGDWLESEPLLETE